MDNLTSLLADRNLWKIALASAVGGLIVVWFAPAFRRLPPKG